MRISDSRRADGLELDVLRPNAFQFVGRVADGRFHQQQVLGGNVQRVVIVIQCGRFNVTNGNRIDHAINREVNFVWDLGNSDLEGQRFVQIDKCTCK